VVRPLLRVEPLSPPAPDLDPFAALVFTSANGIAAFAALTPQRDRPVFAVGDVTAQAARDAGFCVVRSAAGDLTALARLITAELGDALLLAPQAETPAGDLAAALTTAGARNIRLQPLTVYRTIATSHGAPTDCDAVLIHSPRAALELASRGPTAATQVSVVCISAAAAAPLAAFDPPPTVSETPDETSLLATLNATLGKRDPRV
jgi:uroporphyrinogen-III synthase